MSKFITLTNHRSSPIRGMGNQDGLYPLDCDYWEKEIFANGRVSYKHLHRMIVNSGAPYAQIFRDLKNEQAGRLEPIPEGMYIPGPIEFASGVWGDESQIFPDIQSCLWQVIHKQRAIGFHLDGNRKYAPGSAGCPVFRTMADLRTHYNIAETPDGFKSVWVDWYGVGKVNLPEGLKIPK